VARVDFAFHMAGNVLDAVQIGDGCSAEFHNDACHKPLPQPAPDTGSGFSGSSRAIDKPPSETIARPGIQSQSDRRPERSNWEFWNASEALAPKGSSCGVS
jgi:hypothetical protein